ncbi:MAG: hypothetical protein HZB98_02960, partial [Bacteroidia bacterium]|nr:hypothetical protein [Bacteroidia bacterium]
MKKKYLRIIVIAGILSLACTTRVSEWVLLNAVPNQYTLVFFHNGPSGENFKKQNKEITDKIRNANIRFTTAERKDIEKPYYGLYYEDRLFSKYSDPTEMKDLTASPLREKIAAELMEGKLCVMLYLNTGIREKDERGLFILKKSLEA